jgi:protocatechuate 3,4-dioxygenase beta subunit
LAFAVFVLPFITVQGAFAQNLSIVSGDGQVTAQNNLSNYPLVVVAKDASGRPLPGVPVSWSLSGPGNLSAGNQTMTGADGQASTQFVGATIYGDTAFTQSTITASAANSSVTFHATTSASDLISGSIFVTAVVISPVLGQVLTDAGSPPVVQVQVTGDHQAGVQPVPNVSMRLIPDDPNGPTLACAAGTGITDASGTANCRVVFAGPVGSGSFSIEVGGFRTFSPFLFSVTRHTSQPAAIVITGGANQSGQTAAQLPAALTARVQDAAGNALSNVAVVWQPLNSVSLSNVVSTSDANGMVSAIATLGSTVGPAQVQLRTADGAIQVAFNLTVTQPSQPVGEHGTPASILITGGNNQTGPSGVPLPAPLTAKIVDAAGSPVSGAPVTWQAVDPTAVLLSNVVSTSDANGIVTAIATAGTTVGPTQVQLRTTGAGIPTPFGVAGGAVIQAVFNLTVFAAPPGGGGGALPTSFRITGGNNQSGAPGARLPAPLAAQVLDAAGKPVANVPVVWQSLNPQSVSLSGVVSTSDANGMVTAIATLGSVIGPAQVQLQSTASIVSTPFGLAGSVIQTIFNLNVGQSQSTTLTILSGNNQSGIAGARLPLPLTARVVDGSGNPIPNLGVVWQPLNSVSLSNVVSTSDANGMVSAIATLGSATGAAQVQLRTANGAAQVVFNLTVGQSQPVGGHGTPASILITGGNNQTGPSGAPLPAPLTAKILDAAGIPVSGAPVTWQAVNSQAISLSSVVSTSDANGIVSAIATLGTTLGPTQVQLATTVAGLATPFGVAGGTVIQVVFNLTVSAPPPPGGGQGGLPTSFLITGGNNQSGAPGMRLPAPLSAQVLDGAGRPVPNVPVVWQSLNPQAVSLSGVVSTSDANGIVTATATLGSAAGPAQVQLQSTASVVQTPFGTAGSPIQTTFTLTVAQTQPGNLTVLSGNNQSANAGAQLPLPLIARVVDASGNPLPNVTVIWQPVNQSVSLSSVVTTSDANGLVSAIATLGPSAGPAQVQVRIANASVQTVFTLQALLTLSGITVGAGNNQQTVTGGSFGQLLTAQLLALGGPAAGFQVQFISNGAPVFLSNGGVAVSDSNGRATVSVQAGSSPGLAIVTATAGNFSTSFTLTIQAPPPAPLSFFNGASGEPGAVNPAGILAIYGTGVAPGVSGCVAANQVSGSLPMLLSGVTVQFASPGYTASAPLYSVCNLGTGQEYVVVQAPADLPLVDTMVTVQAGGSAVGQSTAPATPASPGIFTKPMSDSVKRAVLQRPDGTYVSLENPAQAGERLQAFVTGLGRPVTASGIALNTNQFGIAGDDAPPPNPVTIAVAGEVLQPVSAIYATDMIGVYVITFDVPGDAPSGSDTAFTVTTTLPDQSVLADSTTLPIQ